MVSGGTEGVLPLYLNELVLEDIVVMTPPTFLCQLTEVIAKLEVTKQTSVTVLPKLTEYDDCCIWTIGGAEMNQLYIYYID